MDLSRYEDDGSRDDVLSISEVLGLLEDDHPSIEHIVVDIPEYTVPRDALLGKDEFERLGRALAKNTNLSTVCLRCAEGYYDIEFDRLFVLRLLQLMNKNRHICHFELHGLEELVDEAFYILDPFLKYNDNLLSFDGSSNDISATDMNILLFSLTRRKSPLRTLLLDHCGIGLEELIEMIKLLKERPEMTPKNISLAFNNIGDKGCFYISEMLIDPNIHVEKLKLTSNSIGKQGLQFIAAALSVRSSPLERLDIGSNFMTDEDLEAFMGIFSTTPALIPKKLSFNHNRIGVDGMTVLSIVLASRHTPLEMLHLDRNNFGLDGLRVFLEVFSAKPNLMPKILNLSENNFDVEWYIALSEMMQNEHCSLEELHIYDLRLDEDTVSHVVASLKNNKRLTNLDISIKNTSNSVWDQISQLLCDTTSIAATYASNHTLLKFGESESENEPFEVGTYLTMNENPNKLSVARVKVINSHFAYNFRLEQFRGMKPALLAAVFEFCEKAFEDHEDFRAETYDFDYPEPYFGGPRYNKLTINYLIVKNFDSIFDFVRPKNRKRRWSDV
ncbi:hypothetical protein ACHAXS_007223 [Conticribra weissflogii]